MANSLAAVEQGANHVQGTINGIGERCGNANLTSILPASSSSWATSASSPEQLARLTGIAHFIDELPTSPRIPTSRSSGATPSPTRAACTSRA